MVSKTIKGVVTGFRGVSGCQVITEEFRKKRFGKAPGGFQGFSRVSEAFEGFPEI